MSEWAVVSLHPATAKRLLNTFNVSVEIGQTLSEHAVIHTTDAARGRATAVDRAQ